MKKSFITAVFMAFFCLLPATLFAGNANATPQSDKPITLAYSDSWCERHPAKCRHYKSQAKNWCERHPAKCHKKYRQAQTWCERNPGKCHRRY